MDMQEELCWLAYEAVAQGLNKQQFVDALRNSTVSMQYGNCTLDMVIRAWEKAANMHDPDYIAVRVRMCLDRWYNHEITAGRMEIQF